MNVLELSSMRTLSARIENTRNVAIMRSISYGADFDTAVLGTGDPDCMIQSAFMRCVIGAFRSCALRCDVGVSSDFKRNTVV